MRSKISKEKRFIELKLMIRKNNTREFEKLYLELQKFKNKIPAICSNNGYAIYSGPYYNMLNTEVTRIIEGTYITQFSETLKLSEKLNIFYNSQELDFINNYFKNHVGSLIDLCIKTCCEESKDTNTGLKYDLSMYLKTFKQNVNKYIQNEIDIYDLRVQLQDDFPEVKLAKHAQVLSIIALIMVALSAYYFLYFNLFIIS